MSRSSGIPRTTSRSPRPRDGRNEPALLPYVVRAIAASQGRTEPEVAAASTATARRFFGLDAAPVTR